MPNKISDLEAQLAHAQTEREEIDALNDLAFKLANHQTERTLALCQRSYRMSSTGDFSDQPYIIGQAASLSIQAYLNRHQGKLDLALQQSHQAYDLLDSQEPTRWAIFCLRTISWSYYFLGDYSDALDYGLQALNISQDLGYKILEASALSSVATIYAAFDDTERAVQYHTEALNISREIGNELLESEVLNNVALILLGGGEYAQALEMGERSLEIAQRLGIGAQEAAVYDTLGQILQKMDDYESAEQFFKKALAISIQAQRKLAEAFCSLSLGKLYLSRQDLKRADINFHNSLDIADKIQADSVKMECHEKLVQLAEQEENWEQAYFHNKALYDVYKKVHNERESKRLAILKVKHQVETSKRDAEIYHLRNKELRREIEELKELSETDPLTNLYNRRHFARVAEMLLGQESWYPISIIIIDIDHFKQINDTYGHAIGDNTLNHLAMNIKKTIRSTDIPARLGGDEFVILMPEADATTALRIAERLRISAIENIIAIKENKLSVTISMGVANTLNKREGSTIDLLLEKADQALYVAKQAGRNLVRFGK